MMFVQSRVRKGTAAPARGVAATAVALLLIFGMGLVIAYTNRSLIFEQRTSANQYRYTKAFETAEAGLEWAVAQLNARVNIDANCAAPAAGDSFRERYLTINPTTHVITTSAVEMMCVIGAAYDCTCPSVAPAVLPATAAPGLPAFKVTLSDVPTAGMLRVTVVGCTSAAGDCHPTGTGTPDATARVTVMLGALPALSTAPGGTITAKGDVSWQGAASALGVINDVADSNGITINAGGTIDQAKVQITTIPGSPPKSSLIDNDQSLSSMSNDQMFATFFGMTKDQYRARAQADQTYVTCAGNCTTTLNNAVNNPNLCSTCKHFWVEGDMDIGGSVTLGTTANPIIVVVNGNITINGNLIMVGLLYAAAPNCTPIPPSTEPPIWNNTGGGSAFLRGAAVSECDFWGNGTPNFYYDPGVLDTLRQEIGAFVKIPGSWKDF